VLRTKVARISVAVCVLPALLHPAVGAARGPQEPAAAKSEPQPSKPATEATQEQPTRSSEQERAAAEPTDGERTSLTWLGWSGVVAMVLGAGSLGTGIGLVAYQSKPARCDAVQDQNDAVIGEYCYPPEATTRPEGWILLGAGAAIFTVGLIRVLIDRPKRRRALATPFVGPSSAGAAVRVRF